MKKIVILMIFLGSLGSDWAYADGDGGTAGAFLRMGFGARAKAMGDAFIAVPEGSAIALYNPAGLSRLQERAITLSSSALPLDRRLDYIGFALALRPKMKDDAEADSPARLNAGFAAGWVHAGTDKIDGRDSNGRPIGDLSNGEHAFYFSFALQPQKMISLGINGKLLYNRFPRLKDNDAAFSSKGFGLDLGVMVTPLNGLTLAAVAYDYNSKYNWNSEGLWDRATSTIDRFPSRYRFGAAYRIPGQWLLLICDYEAGNDLDGRLHLGSEFTYKNIGAIRLGLDDGQLTAGFGLVVPKTRDKVLLNYGFWTEPSGAGSAHIFDLVFRFPKSL